MGQLLYAHFGGQNKFLFNLKVLLFIMLQQSKWKNDGQWCYNSNLNTSMYNIYHKSKISGYMFKITQICNTVGTKGVEHFLQKTKCSFIIIM